MIAFGLRWASEVPLGSFHHDPEPDWAPDIRIYRSEGPPPDRGIVPRETRQHVRIVPDGFRHSASRFATIDAFAPDRIEVYPGPDWTGVPPLALSSTVAALMLAFRGLIPMHGSAIERDGMATLICGPSGTGKSTTAAREIARGGRLISDDLSILHMPPSGEQPRLYAGRRSMRLFESTVASLERAVPWQQPSHASEGKLAVFPPHTPPLQAIPLHRVIVLGQSQARISTSDRAALLAEQLYRPVRLRHAPGHAMRLAKLAIAARDLEVVGGASL